MNALLDRKSVQHLLDVNCRDLDHFTSKANGLDRHIHITRVSNSLCHDLLSISNTWRYEQGLREPPIIGFRG